MSKEKKKEDLIEKNASKKDKKVKVNNKNASVKNKENILEVLGKYFRGVFKEIGRIRWTNGKDLIKYSIATVIFVLFFGIYFYGIDWIALLVRSLAS